jgi:transcription elongation factor Elf1
MSRRLAPSHCVVYEDTQDEYRCPHCGGQLVRTQSTGVSVQLASCLACGAMVERTFPDLSHRRGYGFVTPETRERHRARRRAQCR